jgi:hypothetical protein
MTLPASKDDMPFKRIPIALILTLLWESLPAGAADALICHAGVYRNEHNDSLVLSAVTGGGLRYVLQDGRTGLLREITDATARIISSGFTSGFPQLTQLKQRYARERWFPHIVGEYSGEILKRSEADLRSKGRDDLDNLGVRWQYDALGTAQQETAMDEARVSPTRARSMRSAKAAADQKLLLTEMP